MCNEMGPTTIPRIARQSTIAFDHYPAHFAIAFVFDHAGRDLRGMGDNCGRYIHAMPSVYLKPIGIAQSWAICAVQTPRIIHPYKLVWVSQNAYTFKHPEPTAMFGDLIEAPGPFR